MMNIDKCHFVELKTGDTFKLVKGVQFVNTVYLKIDPVTDKWGNTFIAVMDNGKLVLDNKIDNDTEVVFVKSND